MLTNVQSTRTAAIATPAVEIRQDHTFADAMLDIRAMEEAALVSLIP